MYPGAVYKQNQQQQQQQGYYAPPPPGGSSGYQQQPFGHGNSGYPPPQQMYAAPPQQNYAPPPQYPPSQPSYAPPQSGYAPPPAQYYPPPPPGGNAYQPVPPQMPYQQVPGYDPNFRISNCSGRRRALLIGINYFRQRGELKGCINDVRRVKQFLETYFRFRAEDMVILTDDQQDPRFRPTRANIIAAMHWLVNDARVNDSYFFHYSGHGGQMQDKDGDEADGYDETILPVDYEQAGQIVDDEMHAIMVRPLPPGVRLTALFDSCHSGTALDLPYVYNSEGQLIQNSALKQAGGSLMNAALAYASGNIGGVFSSLSSGFKTLTTGQSAQQQTVATRTTQADVIMFSGCKDSQTSADTTIQGLGSTGAMSFAFISAMTENPHYTYVQLLNRMRDILRGKYSQKPQMSTGRVMDMNTVFIM